MENDKQEEKDSAPSGQAASARADGAESFPSFSNTRETKSESQISPDLEFGIEVWTVDGTERARMTTHGKRTKIVLTPIPLDSALPEVSHIDWLAFTISPSNSEATLYLPFSSDWQHYLNCLLFQRYAKARDGIATIDVMIYPMVKMFRSVCLHRAGKNNAALYILS